MCYNKKDAQKRVLYQGMLFNRGRSSTNFAEPPVSVEEKGKTTVDKKENCYYFCLWAYKIKINFFYVVRRAPEHY
jgi:hypothetical protein